MAAEHAPAVPGVYAYAESDDAVHGLPTDLRWVYVGQTTSLKRRLQHHSAVAETYIPLRKWLRQETPREVWFTAVNTTLLDQVERDLVATLNPRLNRVRYIHHRRVELSAQ